MAVDATLTSRIELPIDRATVFEFFSSAANLALLTPRELHFRIRTPQPIVMAEGTLIDYTIRFWGVPLKWRSRIVRWNPPYEFVDDQLRGPYKSWVHTHRFIPIPGGTAIEDHVVYELRFGPFGRLAAAFVRRQLERLFAYRSQRIRSIFLERHPPIDLSSVAIQK